MKKPISLLAFFGAFFVFSACSSTQFQATETFRVDSAPAGAEVFINGKSVGTTPFSTRLETLDYYTVELRRFGYRPVSVEVVSVMSEQGRSGIRVNPLVTRGYYSSLQPNPVEIDLVSELVPSNADAPRSWEEFSNRMMQVESWYRAGDISSSTRENMRQQLRAFYE